LSLNRSEKEAVVTEVSALAAQAQTLVMAEYRGSVGIVSLGWGLLLINMSLYGGVDS